MLQLKKSNPKSDKVLQQTTIFLPKINISEPNFTKSEGKGRFGQFVCESYPHWQAEKDATKQNLLSFQKVCQKRKMVIKIEFTPL